MKRREFVRLLSCGTLAAAGGSGLAGLVGCGSGGSGSSPGAGGTTGGGTSQNPSGTTRLPVAINPDQIGGSNLVPQSIYQPAGSTGASSTLITSAQDAHLVYLTDSSGSLRALSVANAASPSRQTRSDGAGIQFDAASTALGLVFMSPGIVSTDPSEAHQRMLQIQGAASFASLVSLLSKRLPSMSLQALRSDPDMVGGIGACVDDWSVAYGPSQGKVVQPNRKRDDYARTIAFSPNYSNGVGMYMFANPRGGRGEVGIINNDWREVNVCRQFLDSSGRELGVQDPVYGNIPGRVPASWGTLFTGQASDESYIPDIFDPYKYPSCDTVRYWLRGLGHSGEQLPSSLHSSAVEAWAVTLIENVFFPLCDFALGGGSILAQVLKKSSEKIDLAGLVWQGIRSQIDASKVEIAAGSIGNVDLKTAAASLLDVLLALVGVGATVIGLLGIAGPLGVAAGVLGAILTVAALAFNVATVGLAVKTFATLPGTFHLDLSPYEIVNYG